MTNTPKRQLRLAWGGATDQGRVRANNQDAMFADWGIFVVADGMGGHQGGEVAANLAVRTIANAQRDTAEELHDAISAANSSVHNTAAEQPELHGMGTTVTALAIIQNADGPQFRALNVGDSRIYRMRGGQLDQLTDDHSYVAELIRRGELDEMSAASHPYRNMLTRAIGVHPEVEIDEWTFEPVHGDRYLLCSDGLTNELTDVEILKQLQRSVDPSSTARALVQLANNRGGRDNSTVLVIDVHVENINDIGEASSFTAQSRPILTSPEEPSTEETHTTKAFSSTAESSANKGRSWLYDQVTIKFATIVIALVLAVATTATITSIGWYARSGYHVSIVGDHVVIQKGRVGGLLWFQPTTEEWTEIQVTDLVLADQERLRDGETTQNLSEARNFIANLRERLIKTEAGN